MNLAFADRDFYYGDPYFPPEEPIRGPALQGLRPGSASSSSIRERNDPDVKPGDPYPFQGETQSLPPLPATTGTSRSRRSGRHRPTAETEPFFAGTTSIQAADEKGWVVSVTPSGGWIPAVIAGRTGIGMSQRTQSFVLDEAENPSTSSRPGKRPRVTLTPTLALKDGKPFLSFAVQGGDTQDQNLLQFFLNMVEFGMNVQEACEAANFTSYQMRNSFDDHKTPARAHRHQREDPGRRPGRAQDHGLHARLQAGHFGPHQRHLLRRDARDVLGRVQQPRRRLRRRLVRGGTAKRKGRSSRGRSWTRPPRAGSEPAAGPVGPAKDDAARLDLLDAYSRAVVAVVEAVGPAVVSISVGQETARADFEPLGAGSGFIVAPDGYILTNSHVVAEAKKVKAALIDGTRYSGLRWSARIRPRTWPSSGVSGSKLPYAELGDSAGLQGRPAHHRHGQSPRLPVLRFDRRHQRPRPDAPRPGRPPIETSSSTQRPSTPGTRAGRSSTPGEGGRHQHGHHRPGPGDRLRRPVQDGPLGRFARS